MAPVGYTMRLVDHQQGNLGSYACQNLRTKSLICQSLGRNKQNVDFAFREPSLNRVPCVHVVRIDRRSSNTHAFGSSNLIPHQSQQRRNQKRRPATRLTQQLSRDEVDKTLAPAGLLYDEQAASAFNDVSNGGLLI